MMNVKLCLWIFISFLFGYQHAAYATKQNSHRDVESQVRNEIETQLTKFMHIVLALFDDAINQVHGDFKTARNPQKKNVLQIQPFNTKLTIPVAKPEQHPRKSRVCHGKQPELKQNDNFDRKFIMSSHSSAYTFPHFGQQTTPNFGEYIVGSGQHRQPGNSRDVIEQNGQLYGGSTFKPNIAHYILGIGQHGPPDQHEIKQNSEQYHSPNGNMWPTMTPSYKEESNQMQSTATQTDESPKKEFMRIPLGPLWNEYYNSRFIPMEHIDMDNNRVSTDVFYDFNKYLINKLTSQKNDNPEDFSIKIEEQLPNFGLESVGTPHMPNKNQQHENPSENHHPSFPVDHGYSHSRSENQQHQSPSENHSHSAPQDHSYSSSHSENQQHQNSSENHQPSSLQDNGSNGSQSESQQQNTTENDNHNDTNTTPLAKDSIPTTVMTPGNTQEYLSSSAQTSTGGDVNARHQNFRLNQGHFFDTGSGARKMEDDPRQC